MAENGGAVTNQQERRHNELPSAQHRDVFFFFHETQLSPLTSVLVKGGAPGVRRQTSENKNERNSPRWRSRERQIRSQRPSQQSRKGAQLRRVHVHPCCRLLLLGRLSPEAQAKDATRVQQEDGSGLWSLHDRLNGEARSTGW